MKTPIPFISFAFIFIIFCSGCEDQVEITRTYTVMEPVYMSLDEIRESVIVEEPENFSAIGRIYLYRNIIFVNDPGKGVHVVDNSDPEKPEIIKFISIPGNYNISVKGDILFADSYMDLVALDINDIGSIEIVSRIEGVFTAFNNQNNTFFDPEKGVVVGWDQVKTIEVTDKDVDNHYPSYFAYDINSFAFKGGFAEASAISRTFLAPPTIHTGIGGSMARFTIYGHHLYGIDDSHLYVFDIADLENPKYGFKKEVGFGIETIFPYEEKLFIGSQTGMHIYDISNPDIPLKMSTFEHIRSCDPVVVQDTIAYVTLRGGNACRNGFTNQLDVINIKDPYKPSLITSYSMDNPHGLGIDKDKLFICEGSGGLKIFNVSDIYKINQNLLAEFKGIDAYDVIPYQDILIMIGNDGLYQFNYTDGNNITLLSGIPVVEDLNK